ncbi:putative acyl- n-acyltransferase [Erysiphe neolycopersici]|uniref:N-alpha-acetyltransferase 40 n=1 Tax=Erysiphe neolycopersici TaxID=212602 RepID=A0A420HTU1_9PEZI|nr:putative acyl- n-acyltransferase [Erysiphe neolycopersici]
MKQQEMKYVLVKSRENFQGFMSFMPSYEDRIPVLYCYEIHLLPALRGTGLALSLMKLLESVAAKIPIIEKVMLTCFNRNTRAYRFYTKIGFEIDSSTPPVRYLRNGTKVGADYVIFSKRITHM